MEKNRSLPLSMATGPLFSTMKMGLFYAKSLMRKANRLISKTKWRQILLERRKNLSSERRLAASLLLVDKLKTLKGNVLSFTPIGSEIDLAPLNRHYAEEKRLFLVP